MTKSELLTLLSDAEVRSKIIEVVRFGIKSPPPKPTTATAKSELISLFYDEEVRKELLKILLGEIKPPAPVKKSAPTPAPAPKVEATPTAPKIATPPTAPQPQKSITSTGADLNIMALREKIRSRVTQKAAAPPTVETKPEEIAEVKYTYISEKICPICEQKTRIVLSKARLVADTRDVDFCMHYKDFNPYLYSVWVCENCGYAADDNRFMDRFADRVRKSLREFLSQNNFRVPFIETRTVDDALTFYEAAIYFNDTFEMSFGRQAGLYQKMAWICRIAGDNEQEMQYLRKCAELYEKSLDKERYPIGKVSDNFATYIIGANYFLLKDFEKAAKYLNMIIGNPNIRLTAPKLFEKARDIWQEIRATRK